MKISKRGIELIKHFESFKEKAYQDSGGIWTIGYGNTLWKDGTKVKRGDIISEREAVELMAYWLKEKERILMTKINVPLKQHQFDALISFIYNAGTGYYSNKKYLDYNIFKKVNDNSISKEYWENLAITAGGKVLNGLKRRRRAEWKMFNCGLLDFT